MHTDATLILREEVSYRLGENFNMQPPKMANDLFLHNIAENDLRLHIYTYLSEFGMPKICQ